MSDLAARKAAFEWLTQQVDQHGDVLDWSLLLRGFEFESRRVPLLSQQGIFKPAVCDRPLSIRTSVASPYDDRLIGDRLVYSYRGDDPQHADNRGLRELFRRRIPLIYFLAVVKSRYLAVWPVFIVGDDPANLRFWVQAEDVSLGIEKLLTSGVETDAGLGGENARREYATRLVQRRLHQRSFRERVLDAYRSQCSMCRLRHREFLDAAHIKPDSQGGEPVVSNGLSLCKIHHTAFDLDVLGVRPDTLRIKVRSDVLQEIDGPMLRYGLQGLENHRLWTPKSPSKRPDPALLAWKWDRFERAG